MSSPLGDKPLQLGAVWEGDGTRFTLLSPHASRVDLCLFDPAAGDREIRRFALEPSTTGLWQSFIEEAGPGQAYGFRVDGPWEPTHGHRFNTAKLLVDPAARLLTGGLTWCPAVYGSDPHRHDTEPNREDSAPFVPKAVVVDQAFDWRGDQPPATPWTGTVIYECHIRGMTMLHPDIPEHLRGTYLGLVQEPILEHLHHLSVTAVELMPVQHFVTEEHLWRQGKVNYFGYNPLGFSAPHGSYATADGRQVDEFKTMVRELHRAGIEVILDVVFNHSAEGNHLGPTLSLKGIDNRSFYRLQPENRRGNTLHAGQSAARHLILASLRYWVEEMHVDGFRFDLAPCLGREERDFSAHSTLLRLLRSDPVVATVKLIAEPWDLGPGGYRLGEFPDGWCEWNDRYRDTLRAFWRGDRGLLPTLSRRLLASPDIFAGKHRPPHNSVHFVTSHDGFTLHDLVSYESKHNWDNGEQNRDGHDHNLSRNWGVEGPTDSEEIVELREQIKRCLLATLALSQGVPMLSHGDELGRTQRGNNNVYCQDGPLTWIHWELQPGAFRERRVPGRPGPMALYSRLRDDPGRLAATPLPALRSASEDFCGHFTGGVQWRLSRSPFRAARRRGRDALAPAAEHHPPQTKTGEESRHPRRPSLSGASGAAPRRTRAEEQWRRGEVNP
jgi:glycogen operon protein